MKRQRLKRMIREAFRHVRAELPRPAITADQRAEAAAVGSYDVVVLARRHEELSADDYQAVLRGLVGEAHAIHRRRSSGSLRGGRDAG